VAQSTVYTLLGILALLVVAAVFIVLALRLTSSRRNAALAFGFFLVAVVFGIAAIATITFVNKARFS
jgi:predicted membrane channel-forming protein YqfA (hemolysin III family)